MLIFTAKGAWTEVKELANEAYKGYKTTYPLDYVLKIAGNCGVGYWAGNSYTAPAALQWDYGQTKTFTKMRIRNNHISQVWYS